MAAPPPPPPLNYDVTAEILLRLPPDEPEHLFRAALVCKPWLRIICDPDFRRRYREFHGAPPLLGLLHCLVVYRYTRASFDSTTLIPAFPYPISDGRFQLPLDCRHGRVLIRVSQYGGTPYLVWDPVTGDRHYLPREPRELEGLVYFSTVLCTTDGCDHLDCHGGPFRVVCAAMERYDGKGNILASVYSSETDAWSVPVWLDDTCECFAQHKLRMPSYYKPHILPRRGALVGDGLYFTLEAENAIVKYDLVTNRLSMIDADPPESNDRSIALMAIENNTSLGFAYILGSSLCVWKMDMGEAAEWVQYRVIELENTIPVANPKDRPLVVGFAEGVDVIFVKSGSGLFTIKLISGLVKRVDEPDDYFSVLPYMSFYLPETGNGGGHDATDLQLIA